MKKQEFLYDRLLDRYDKGKEFRDLSLESEDDFSSFVGEVPEGGIEERRAPHGKSLLFEKLKNEAKVILIDEMTLDSLLNHPYSNECFKGELKLPFHDVFFEFSNPLEYRTWDWGSVYDLGGFLFYYLDTDKEKGPQKPNSQKERFSMILFDDGGYCGDARISLSETDGLFTFSECDHELRAYHYLYKPLKRRLFCLNRQSYVEAETLENIPDDVVNIFKLANLSINTINYINAQNITIKKGYREERRVSLPGGRKKKSKRFLVQSKPYYWIEIEKRVYEEKEGEPGHSWELEYRVWVRGHFRHYQDGKRIWIEPFVKGPPDAPWKHNRYKVLYDRFKHLLKNPKYIDDNSQKNPF